MKFLAENNNKKIVLALGFFDCLHKAHREIIEKAISEAKGLDAESCVLTFTGNLKNSLQIYDFDDRVRLLEDIGVENVLKFDFSPQFASIKPEDFFKILVGKYGVVGVVCGYDYKFGKDARGDVDLLKDLCAEYGVKLFVLEKKLLNGSTISTSKIKDFLSSGDIDNANSFLFKPYHIKSEVVKGRGEGHLFGFPTANLSLKNDKILPKSGVYGTMCDINGKIYKSVTNVGVKPTFNDDTVSIETFIDDFSGNLYGENITIIIYKYLRETKKFDNINALKEQIYEDMRW